MPRLAREHKCCGTTARGRDIVKIQLHGHIGKVAAVRMILGSFKHTVTMRRKLLAWCVAKESAALVELHKARTVLELGRQTWKQHLEKPVRQLWTVNDDSVSIASARHQPLHAATDVEQRWREALGIHTRDQCCAILLAEGISNNPSKAAPACAARRHRQILYLDFSRSRVRLVNKLRSFPWQASAIWIVLLRETLIRLPARPVKAGRWQSSSRKERHARRKSSRLLVCWWINRREGSRLLSQLAIAFA
mmetsp:Transcript_50807/g.128130  ORF Transcript_50807/g.128130 Transcript_50807/m.128130 type:complete len:249 (+) Transcript_50807:337-1083(+)